MRSLRFSWVVVAFVAAMTLPQLCWGALLSGESEVVSNHATQFTQQSKGEWTDPQTSVQKTADSGFTNPEYAPDTDEKEIPKSSSNPDCVNVQPAGTYTPVPVVSGGATCSDARGDHERRITTLEGKSANHGKQIGSLEQWRGSHVRNHWDNRTKTHSASRHHKSAAKLKYAARPVPTAGFAFPAIPWWVPPLLIGLVLSYALYRLLTRPRAAAAPGIVGPVAGQNPGPTPTAAPPPPFGGANVATQMQGPAGGPIPAIN